MGKLQVQHSTTTGTIGALGALDVISWADNRVGTGRAQGVRITKIEGYMWYSGRDGEADGQCLIGFAQGGLSAAEIEECLEANPQGETDQPEMEEARRMIHPIGFIPPRPCTTAENAGDFNNGMVLNKHGGHLFEIVPIGGGISLPEGTALTWWAYNTSATSGTTAGFALTTQMKFYYVWRDD